MYKDKYIFPAIFSPNSSNGYTITFPDFDSESTGYITTEGNTLEESLFNAQEALELHLFGLEEDGDDIPEPTPPEDVKVTKDDFVVPIRAWMQLRREKESNKAVKKTLTIPNWLNQIAEENNVNFSQVLQTALKDLLGLLPSDKES